MDKKEFEALCVDESGIITKEAWNNIKILIDKKEIQDENKKSDNRTITEIYDCISR